MSAPRLRHGACTDVGLVRAANQDAWGARGAVFVVADGMGGHEGGEIASSIVVDEVAALDVEGLSLSQASGRVQDALGRAQARIRTWGENRSAAAGPWRAGTTVVLAVAVPDGDGFSWLVGNVGDSRVYRVHEGALHQVTTDHSVVQVLLETGRITPQEALVHPERHVITRALGSTEGVRPDFFVVPGAQAPRLLLCTDGVHGMVEESTLARLLAAPAAPQQAAEAVVAAALAEGGRDNATAVVVDVVGWPSDEDR